MRNTKIVLIIVLWAALLGTVAYVRLTQDDSGPKDYVVRMTNDMTFDPHTLTIRPGDTVTWKNVSKELVHSVTTDANKVRNPNLVLLPVGAEAWDSGLLQPGESWSYTFQIPGTYHYVCVPHELVGMVGEIIVNNDE
ncbi:MAG: hypothetical protein HZC02_02800 [Candidatus Levybacteria bacterium]|nr:hypothetical protein [Candidatus Levybacteria bacterium]